MCINYYVSHSIIRINKFMKKLNTTILALALSCVASLSVQASHHTIVDEVEYIARQASDAVLSVPGVQTVVKKIENIIYQYPRISEAVVWGAIAGSLGAVTANLLDKESDTILQDSAKGALIGIAANLVYSIAIQSLFHNLYIVGHSVTPTPTAFLSYYGIWVSYLAGTAL